MTPTRKRLRDATQADHARVDAAFARYDLSDRYQYGAFLIAHARVLPGVEGALRGVSPWADWRARMPALLADLHALGAAAPAPIAFPASSDAANLWGLFYVLEGSKLGGAFLARKVAGDLPQSFLSAGAGRWGAFLGELEQAFAVLDDAAPDRAIEAARLVFEAFLTSVEASAGAAVD